jgi:hypothetical protein
MTDEELISRFDGMENRLVALLRDVKESLTREMHAVLNQVGRLDSTITGMSFQLAGIRLEERLPPLVRP